MPPDYAFANLVATALYGISLRVPVMDPGWDMVEINLLDTLHPILQSVLDPSWIFYWVGPKFTPGNPSDVEILGEYDSGNSPAVLAFEYGSGRVFIIGTHPEFEEDSNRDGLPPDSALNDMGSDWELMENAALWCTGKL